jgi:hypothetical protein
MLLGCCQVLLGCCQVLLGVARCCWGVARCCWVLPGAAGVLLGCCWVLLGVADAVLGDDDAVLCDDDADVPLLMLSSDADAVLGWSQVEAAVKLWSNKPHLALHANWRCSEIRKIRVCKTLELSFRAASKRHIHYLCMP